METKSHKTPATHLKVGTLSSESQRRIERGESELMRALSFRGVDVSEDGSRETKKNGGMYYHDNVIHVDPAFLDHVKDRPLAFFLAHELGEKWFQEAFEVIWANVSQRFDSERRLKSEANKLRHRHDDYADLYAIRKLFESGWNLEQLARCLAECRSHLQSYLSGPGPNPRAIRELDEWLSRMRIACYYMWLEFQRAQADSAARS